MCLRALMLIGVCGGTFSPHEHGGIRCSRFLDYHRGRFAGASETLSTSNIDAKQPGFQGHSGASSIMKSGSS